MRGSLQPVSTSRLGVVLASVIIGWATGGVPLLLAARSCAAAVGAQGVAGLDGLVATAASLVGLALLSWLAVSFIVSALDLSRDAAPALLRQAAPGRARSGRLHPPRAVRRLAAFVLGLSLVAGTAGPVRAAATPVSPTSAPVATAPAAEGAAATWTPDRPAPTAVRMVLPDVGLVTAAPRLGAEVSDEIAVRRGDSLWAIAARHLGPAARADDVARSWPLWWQANRHVIGDNPDLIYPGQVLVAPAGAQG